MLAFHLGLFLYSWLHMRAILVCGARMDTRSPRTKNNLRANLLVFTCQKARDNRARFLLFKIKKAAPALLPSVQLPLFLSLSLPCSAPAESHSLPWRRPHAIAQKDVSSEYAAPAPYVHIYNYRLMLP
jgi:hypothetical protein